MKISYEIRDTAHIYYIFIRNIFITKKYRSVGIGKSVVSEILKFCESIGINITLNISDIYGTPYNVLFNFYINLGFVKNNNKNIFDGDFIYTTN